MKRVIILLLAISLISASRVGVERYDTTAKYKAIFLYNFASYINWPANYKQGNFVVGVFGETPVYKELSKMALTRKAVNQKIIVRKYTTVSEIEKCHILYVTSENANSISECVSKTKANSTLVVGEGEELTKEGAGINFVIRDNRVKFIMNRKNIESKKLRISTSLIPRALMVE